MLAMPWVIPWGELLGEVRGWGRDVWLGRHYLIIDGLGRVYINRNVARRFDGIEGVLKAPRHYIAAINEWGGRNWLFRLASPDYVDVRPELVLNAVRDAVNGALTEFGRWRSEVAVREGATYASYVFSLGEFNEAYVGRAVLGVRVSFGNDGFTAFRVVGFLGVLACTNGLVVGHRAYGRVFHTHAVLSSDPVKRVLERVRDAVRRSLSTLDPSRIEEQLDEWARQPVDREVLMRYGRAFGSEFVRLWQIYSQRHGETVLALLQALSWFATHAGETKSARAERAMIGLLAQ